MEQQNIIVISGPCGSGKSSVARAMAEHSAHPRTTHMHTDDFYKYICKGYVEPWKPDSNGQNAVVAEAIAACAIRFAEGGYEVFVDGVIGPWNLKPWIRAANNGAAVHYAILRPTLQTTVRRGISRTGSDALVDQAVIEKMWKAFDGLGLYEPHVIDTTSQTVEESAAMVGDLINEGRLRIK